MARSNSNTFFKDRNGRKQIRQAELGYYLIVTDTEATERCYFNGLYQSLPNEIKKKLVIKVIETRTQNLIDKCNELIAYDAQYRIPWIIFDKDLVYNFDKIIKEAEKKGINVGWSNPCFEIWMHAYFGAMPKSLDSTNCCNNFSRKFEKITGHKYEKTDEKIYERLYKNGNENSAIKLATQKLEQNKKEGKVKPSEMNPCTTVHILIDEIKKKIL